MMQTYSPEIEQAMKKNYATLSEKDRRRYAAIEALKLGHGGQVYNYFCSEVSVPFSVAVIVVLPR